MIKVPVAFCCTCCDIGVVNLHGHMVNYIYEQETNVCMCCVVKINKKNVCLMKNSAAKYYEENKKKLQKSS